MNPWPAFAGEPRGARRWVWKLRGGRSLELGGRLHLMGIVNVTPDSFHDGGRFLEASEAIEHGLRLAGEGADILDVGGQSTRPGSEEVPAAEELRRVLPVIEGLRRAGPVCISIDTHRAEVARQALAAGADIVNDISAFRFDEAMLGLLAESGAPAVAMHIQGRPRDMQKAPQYGDVVREVLGHLRAALDRAERAGVPRSRLAVDPGIGFGKTVEHNLELLRNLSAFRSLLCPVVVGASHKSFIGQVLDDAEGPRLEGTLAVTALASAAGADIVRVHDVLVNRRAARLADAVVGR